jgi:CSLREA domain-containing protein
MKTKVWFYLSIITLSACLAMPVIVEPASVLAAGEGQAKNGLVASSSQASFMNADSILTTIQVTSTSDNTAVDGYCTLREALQAANTHSAVDTCQEGSEYDNTITFSVAGTITLAAGNLNVNTVGGSLVIDGGGAITISAANSSGVFVIGNLTNVTLENLTITAGNAPVGAGIYNNGSVTILNSTLSSNQATSGDARGGGVYNNVGSVFIKNSTLYDNFAASGGAIYNDNGFLALTNSTLSGNDVASEGGGIYSTGSLYLASATIVNNHADILGGGVYTQNHPLYLRNTILAQNTAGENAPDCYSTAVTTDGYNLVGNTSGCAIHPWTGDLTNVAPKLGPLQDNGGLNYTHALLPGSLAVDHGNRYGCTDFWGTPLATDQRGFPRVGKCDIGAFEWQPAPAAGPYTMNLPCAMKSCSRQLYFDDFSNPSSGWKILENSFGRYEYLNNEYRILTKVVPAWEASFPGYKATNYVVSADVRNATGVNGYAGILFGFAPDWSHFYFFVVNNTGSFTIVQWNLETSYWISNGYSGAIHLGTAVNQLKLERNGSMIWAYANGELLSIVKDDSFTGSGYVGLIVIADTNLYVDARFDNFRVEPISCGASYSYPKPEADANKIGTAGMALPENWQNALRDLQIGK